MRPKNYSKANRGKAFENLIEESNRNYIEKGIAFIQKIPTPVKVLAMNGHFIVKGWFDKKSTVDYFGIYRGKMLFFEAKSTKERKRFPLSNIHEHQMNVLELVHNQGGLSFFLVEFHKHSEVYYMTFDQVIEWWKKAQQGGRKSIPYDWFTLECPLVRSHDTIPLHFLQHIKGCGQ